MLISRILHQNESKLLKRLQQITIVTCNLRKKNMNCTFENFFVAAKT